MFKKYNTTYNYHIGKKQIWTLIQVYELIWLMNRNIVPLIF